MAMFLRKRWIQKPPESYQIDWNNPLADNLAVFIDADGDHVSGHPLYLMGNARRESNLIYSPGDTPDGAYVPFPPLLNNTTTQLSAICFASLTSISNYGKIFGIPYRGGTSWSVPYEAMSMCQYGTSLQLYCDWANSSYATALYTNTSILATDNVMNCYAMRKNSSSASILFNSVPMFPIVKNGNYTELQNFSLQQPITIANRSSTSPGESSGGYFGPLLIYNEYVSYDKIKAINENPYQIFQPRRILFDLGVNQQILNVAAGWRVLTLKDIPSAWDVLAEKESAAAWHVQAEKQESSGWDVLAEKQETAAWNVLAEKQQSASWRILASRQAVAAWRVLHVVLAAISWHVLTMTQVSSAWRVLAQNVAASGWMIFTRKVAASSWSILASGPKVVATAWRVLAERPAAASWHVLTQRSAASGWRVLASKAGAAGWRVFNALVAASSWIIGAIASGHETIRLKSPITMRVDLESPITREIKGKSEITTEVNLESKIW